MVATAVFLTVYIVVCMLALGVFMFGDKQSKGPLGRLTLFATETCPAALKSGVKNVPFIGGPLSSCCNGFITYTFYKRNPLMQIFFLVLILGGFSAYEVLYSHLVPNKMLGEIHIYLPWILISYNMISFYLSCYTSAGVITPQTVDKYDHHDYDGLFYVKTKCTSCKVPKVPRSKHCKLCGVCVAKFDHHCPWINTCVGEDNYRFFMNFLFSTLLFLVYACYVLISTLFAEAERLNLFGQLHYVSKTTGRKVVASPFVIFQYMMFRYGIMMALIFLCGVMGLVVTGFFGYHIYLIYKGMTTNETAKWDQMNSFYKRREQRIARCESYFKELKDKGEFDQIVGRPLVTVEEEKLNPDKAPTLWDRWDVEYPEKKPVNIYDYGFKDNLRRVLFPSRYQQKAKTKADKKKKN